MRQRAEWMNPIDDQILEYLQDQGGGTPKSIADTLGRNNDYVGTRCRLLSSYGLITRPTRGFYTLTEAGEDFLAGELDAATLEANGGEEEP